MIKLSGKVLNLKIKENEEGAKTTMFNLVDENYNNIYINVKGEFKDFNEKFIEADVIGNAPFYNILEEESLKIIEDKEDIRATLNNVIEKVKVIDILENKEKVKSLVILNANNKILKVKLVESEKYKIEQMKEKFKNKIIDISNVLTYTNKDTKQNYFRIKDFKSNIKPSK